MIQAGEAAYFVVDLRAEFRRNPYITLWRPDDAGYCYPLPWAGRYSKTKIDAGGGYYSASWADKRGRRRFLRFPVLTHDAEALAVPPARGIIDGNAGPALRNNAETRAKLLALRYGTDKRPLSAGRIKRALRVLAYLEAVQDFEPMSASEWLECADGHSRPEPAEDGAKWGRQAPKVGSAANG